MAASPTNAKASEGRVSEKATTSAPVTLRISRREGLRCKFMTASSSNGSALDRAHDGGMGAETAKVRHHMASMNFVRRIFQHLATGWHVWLRTKRTRRETCDISRDRMNILLLRAAEIHRNIR